MSDTATINLSAYKSPRADDLNIASTKLELELLQPDLAWDIAKVNKKDFTFVIPIYNLKAQALKNFLWVLPQICATGCKVIVAEQLDRPKPTAISEIIKPFVNIKYITWLKHYEEGVGINKFQHRTALINYIVKYHVDTEWVWVNNSNIFVKWNNIFSWIDPVYNYIVPYKMCKRMSEEDTKKIVNREKVEIDFGDMQGSFSNILGDDTFICRRSAYIEDGGMDENFVGVYLEGLDFYRMILLKNKSIQNITSQYAINLYNEPLNEHEWNDLRKTHAAKIQAKFGHTIKSLETVDDQILTTWRRKKPKLRHRNDMAVITCHFNWSGYKRPVCNLNRFIRYMESKQIPVYGVELSLTGEFATKNNENWLHIRCKENNILFQKECLLNLAEKMVPPEYTKIAWFDHDVFLDNDTWYDEVSFALDSKQIVQVFETCYWTTETGTIAKELPAMCKFPPKEDQWTGHPGFGIAARRTMWGPDIGGLYPYCPLGHGDTTFMYSIFEMPISVHTQIGVGLHNCPDFAPYHKWYNNIVDFAAGKPIGSGEGKGAYKLVGYAQGNCIHEWHGDIFNRSYVDRAFLMTWYNPSKHIFINEQGILELRNTPLTWTRMIQKYFMDRREDGTLLEGVLE